MRDWQMREAESRFSDLLEEARQEGPQEIIVQGKPVAVVLSKAEYDRLAGAGKSLVTFMQCSPLHGLDELELDRDRSLTREFDL